MCKICPRKMIRLCNVRHATTKEELGRRRGLHPFQTEQLFLRHVAPAQGGSQIFDMRHNLLALFLHPPNAMPQVQQHNTPACQGQLGTCHEVRPGLAVKRVREVVAPPPPGIDAACPLLQPPTLLGSVERERNVTADRKHFAFLILRDHTLPCDRGTYASDGDPVP